MGLITCCTVALAQLLGRLAFHVRKAKINPLPYLEDTNIKYGIVAYVGENTHQAKIDSNRHVPRPNGYMPIFTIKIPNDAYDASRERKCLFELWFIPNYI